MPAPRGGRTVPVHAELPRAPAPGLDAGRWDLTPRRTGTGAPRPRLLFRRALFALLGAWVLGPGRAGADPEDGGRRETIRGPWSGSTYTSVRQGRTKGFVGPDGTRYATPLEVVEADARTVDPLRLVLAGDLADVARDPGRGGEPVLVTILFREQPLHDAGTAARGRHAPRIAAARARAREILDRIAPLRSVRPDAAPDGARVRMRDVMEEESLLLTAEEKDELLRIRDLVLAEQAEAREEALADATEDVDLSQAAVRAFLADLPDAVVHSRTVALNALTATVPAGALVHLAGEFPEIARIGRDRVLRPALGTSTGTIGADDWWTAGWIGSTSTPVAILDTGIDAGHPGLSGQVSASGIFHAAAKTWDSNYADSSTNGDDFYGHGTHVAGIVASTDSTYAGVAHGARLMNAKISYVDRWGDAWSYDSDVRAGADWAANNGAVVMNYSFGGASSTTDGSDESSLFFDAVCHALAIPVAVSAGNEGPGSSTVTVPGDAYNVVTVGNFNDGGTTSASNDTLSSGSSRGPLSDGRLKPDLSAPGTNIRSAAHDWEGSASDYVDLTGTSMAAPHVAGAMALLLDQGAAANPEGLKALLIGTCAHASPYNTTPNDDWGHGALDLGRAYACRASVVESTLESSGKFVFLRGGALSAGGRITLAWNRHVTSNGSSAVTTYYDLTDLDLYVYDESTGNSLGAGTSSIDPVEQVEVASAVTSPVIQVYRYGSFPSGVSSEPWAVATESTGATALADPPALACGFPTLAGGVAPGATFQVDVAVTNTGDLRAFAPSVTLIFPTGFTLVSGANPQTAGNVASGASATASWTVRAPAAPTGAHVLRADATSESYDETWSAPQASVTLYVDGDAPSGTVVAPEYAPGRDVSVTLSATDPTSRVDAMRLRDAAAAWGPWIPYATSATVQVSAGDGARTVQAEFRDPAGNVSATASDTVVVDSVAPVASLALASGAQYWNSVTVPVYVAAVDATSGVRQMRFSSNGSTWRSWRAYFPTTTESLLASNGTQTVYVQVADAAGNLSAAASAVVTLDTVVPTGSVVLLGDAPYTRPWAPLTADLTLSADVSGVDSFRYRVGGGAWSEWLPYLDAAPAIDLPPEVADRLAAVTFEVRDRAMYVSPPFSDSIHALAPDPQDGTGAKSVRGTMSPGADFDAYRLDLVAGQTLTVKVAAKPLAKRAEVRVDLDLYGPDGTRLVEGRHPATSRKAGILKLPVSSSGRHWLVVRATGTDAATGANYSLAASVKTPAALLGPAGEAVAAPGGAEIAFDAVPGWTLTATFAKPASGTPTLVAPDGTETVLPALRKSGRRAMALEATVLAGGAGTYRLLVPGAATSGHTLALAPPKARKVVEATSP